MPLKRTVVIIRIITLMAVFFALNNLIAFALPKHTSYVLLCDRLYDYGSNTSDVLRQYVELKSAGQDVFLLQADKIDTAKIDRNAVIIIFASSFESTDKYNKVLYLLKDFRVMIHNGLIISPGERAKKPGLFIAINGVYPFSDLNKLMDMAESLNDQGIEFIVSVMPVFDNYYLRAFKKYVDVLKYVEKKGGKLFIHIPVVNNEGRYNLDSGVLFEKAVKEFRKQGLDILGITLPQNRMLNDIGVYQGLDLPFILVTETEGRISPELDLFQTSQVLNNYIIIKGTDINHFDYFGYKGKTGFVGEQAASISIYDNEDKLFNLLNIFKTERIPVMEFRVGDYRKILQNSGYTQNGKVLRLQEKTQHEKFMEEEMKKIKGENLKQEKFVKGYDISRFSGIAVRVAIMLLGIFSVMVWIGRRFNYRKFVKNQLYRE